MAGARRTMAATAWVSASQPLSPVTGEHPAQYRHRPACHGQRPPERDGGYPHGTGTVSRRSRPRCGHWSRPHAATDPAAHEAGCWLLAAGDEGYLRDGPAGPRVEWVRTPRIWCEGCAASWGLDQWPHLGRLLRDTAAVPA